MGIWCSFSSTTSLVNLYRIANMLPHEIVAKDAMKSSMLIIMYKSCELQLEAAFRSSRISASSADCLRSMLP